MGFLGIENASKKYRKLLAVMYFSVVFIINILSMKDLEE